MNRFIRTIVVLGWVLGSGSCALAGEDPPGATVESLLSIARESNLDLAVMRHEASAAEQRLLPAGSLMPPRFKMELEDLTRSGEQSPSLLPSEVGGARYTVSQDLPWAGKRDLRSAIAGHEIDAAQARAQQTWSELAARIQAVFVQRYQIGGSQRLVNENLDLMLQLEKVLQVRYAGGLAAQQDITRIHVEHTGMRSELAALAGEWRQTQARLNGLLARPFDAPLSAPQALRSLPTAEKLGFEALAERVRRTNPLLQAEAARALSAQKNRDLIRKNRYPDFTVGVSAMQRQRSVNEWGLMVELNLPIQGDVFKAQERESDAMLAAAHARKEALTHQLLADLSENLAALETARQTAHLVTYSLMPQAELTWRSALSAYENAKADFANLLDAQRQIRGARLALLKAQVDAQMRLIDIEKLVGEAL